MATVIKFPVIPRKPAGRQGRTLYLCLRVSCAKKIWFDDSKLDEIWERNCHNVMACSCGAEMRPVEGK